MRVGFFGGTFDPIHVGHINLALSLAEVHELDKVLFSPANYSPEKAGTPPVANGFQRKEMTRLAIEDIPQFSLIDLELEREGPSYTIDTIRALKNQSPSTQYFLILGEDILSGLPRWKDVEELLKLAPPLVGTRPGNGHILLPANLQKLIAPGKTPIPQMEICSTDLRKRLTEKKVCSHLIPSKVLDFIEQEGLYFSNYAERPNSNLN